MAIVAKKVQEAKTASINELKESFAKSQDFIFTEYRGLTVAQITELRRTLLKKNAEYKVVKNNFARIAFKDREAPEEVKNYLTGPTAVAIAPQDSNEVAKSLFDFTKDVPVLKIKGSLIGGVVYNEKDTEAFSKLPGRLQLISMLMSVMNGPMRNLAGALNDIPARLMRTIKAIGDQKGQAAPAA
jgi:large subunit ribosomal protein L10